MPPLDETLIKQHYWMANVILYNRLDEYFLNLQTVVSEIHNS